MQPQVRHMAVGVICLARSRSKAWPCFSSVLNSEQAIEVNIAIMRAFVRLRQILETNEELNRKFAAVINKLSTHDRYFRVVFDELKKLTEKPRSSGRQIGFKGQ